MGRSPIIHLGQSYALDHIDPFTVQVPTLDGLRVRKLLVSFGLHCFTVDASKCDPVSFTEVSEDGDARAFCAFRHGWSQSLPQIVRYHVAGKAFESRDRNGAWGHFFYERKDRLVPYAVYFRLEKSSKGAGIDGILRIVSAYENADLPATHKFQSINFARLVDQRM